MNIQYRNVFLALIASLLIAIPTAAALNHKSNEVNIEKSKSNQLQFDLKKRESTLQKTIDEKVQTEEQLKQKADEAEKLKQQNEQLQKDLQAKREKQANDAKLAAAPKAAVSTVGSSGNCESYRPLVQKYFGDATEAAMITIFHESGCNPNAVSPTNDHGLMQLNNMAIYDPEANIRAGYAKFVSPRRGTRPNFSAWYAVCTANQVPKYAGIWCA